jgi:probable addiction module antidote protein
MKTEYAPFDISDHLDSEEMIAGYLTAAAEDDDPDVLLGAIAHVAKARGMTEVAKASGLGRESLYKALAPGAQPRFSTVQAVLKALNVRLSLHAPVSSKLAKARLAKARFTRPPHKLAVELSQKEESLVYALAQKRTAKKAAAKRPASAKSRA